MTTDSVTQLVRYQRKIGALPQGTGFSVRTHWAGPLSRLGGSVRTYLADYEGVTTYIKLMGRQTTSIKQMRPQDTLDQIIGVISGLLNGSNAGDPNQSPSWNAIMYGLRDGYNTANNTSWQTINMDWFHILSPASNVASITDAISLMEKLVAELYLNHSVTASGQFKLDIQTGANIAPDPRPVFDWSLVISLDSSTQSITLKIDIVYDHMESNSIWEGVLGVAIGIVLYYIGVGPVLSAAGGIAVGVTSTQIYNDTLSSKLLQYLGGHVSQLPWINIPPYFTFSHPQPQEFVITVTYQLPTTVWNDLMTYIQDAAALQGVLDKLGAFGL